MHKQHSRQYRNWTNNRATDNAWLADSYCDTFKIVFVNNAVSLKRHFKQFKELLEDDPSYHVMEIAESHFGDAVEDNIIAIKGYSSIRQDRNTQGGGVVLYIKKNFRASVLARSNTTKNGKPDCFEYLTCRISGKEIPPIFVCLIYLHPMYLWTLIRSFYLTCATCDQIIVIRSLWVTETLNC